MQWLSLQRYQYYPYKHDVLPFVEVLDPVARRIGAVNTLLIREAGDRETRIVHGCNTDWIGANQALAERIGLKGTRVLIVGAGGSARAIGFGLLEAGAGSAISNRTVEKGETLAGELGCPFYGPGELDRVRAEVLVNATSVGMAPDTDRIPVPPGLLPRFCLLV